MKKVCLRTISIFLLLALLLSAAACVGEPSDIEQTDDSSSDTTGESSSAEPEGSAVITLEELAGYTLVRPEKVSSELLEVINSLNRKLKELEPNIAYKDDYYREGTSVFSIGEYEILVGKTNREETKSFLSELRYNDYGYAMVDKKLVIAGHTDEATENAVLAFIKAILDPGKSSDGVFYSASLDYLKRLDYDIDTVLIGQAPITDYRLVYPAADKNSEKVAAQLIANSIAAACGTVIDVVDDGEPAAELEILIGKTNRNTDAEIAEMSKDIAGSEAVIGYDGKRINVFGATSTALLVAANEFGGMFKGQKTDKLELSLSPKLICKIDDSILSAMSFNVWVSGKSDERNERVLNMVRSYFPDTVGFQEVDPTWLSTLRNGLKDQYDYVGEGRDGGNNGEYNPIFYRKDKFNLIDSGTKWLSDSPNRPSKVYESSLNRIYTYALLERRSDGVKLMVVNTHLEHTSEAAREKQAKFLVDFLKSAMDYPIILTGDFNCTDASQAYTTIVSCGMSNSFKVADNKINNSATFTSYGSASKIIDFVFVSPNASAVMSYKVCDEKINNAFPSDHHPVLIEYAPIG